MKYKVNRGFITQKLEDKTVIFDSDESILYTFNESASFIFNKLKKGRSKEQIIADLMKKYNTKEVEIKKDFEEFISNLESKKIVSSIKPKK